MERKRDIAWEGGGGEEARHSMGGGGGEEARHSMSGGGGRWRGSET